MTSVQFTVFDRTGKPLADIEPMVQSATWILNDEGQLPFFMPFTDDETTRENLQFGNRFLAQFDNGLKPWGGVLDTPRSTTSTGVNVTAYSAEHILKWRRTIKQQIFDQLPPGVIYQTLIATANALFPTRIEIGSIYAFGSQRSYEFHYDRLYDQIVNLARDSGEDFDITPVLAGGQLSFEANWHVAKGFDRTNDVILREGDNAGGFTFNEAGEIANRIYIVGSGSTWEGIRLVGEANDGASQDQFDFREFARTQHEVTNLAATLQANADVTVTELANPRVRLTLTTIDKNPGLFADYDIGDTVQVVGALKGGDDWAIVGNYRLRSRQWSPNNTVVCALEEVA